MIQYLKYLSSLNLITLTSQIIGNLSASSDFDSDRAFYQLYKWRSIKDGFEESKITKKPVLLLIHKQWCPSCQKLKVKFSKNIRLIDLSSQFVMINVDIGKDVIGNEEKFQPDGKYVPRILFLTSDGDLIKEAYNRQLPADEKHKYFYSSPAHLIETMLFVLKEYSKEPDLTAFTVDKFIKPDPLGNHPTDDIFSPTVIE